MTISGNITPGASAIELGADRRYLSPMVLTAGYFPKVSAYMDGLGSAGPLTSQSVRACVYNSAGALVATSATVVIPNGMTARWVDFTFITSALKTGPLLAAGTYYVGLHCGSTDRCARFWSSYNLNLVTNPSIEIDATGYATGGTAPTTFARQVSLPFDGTASLNLTVTLANSGNFTEVTIPTPSGTQQRQACLVYPGQTWSFQVRCNVTTQNGGVIHVLLDWLNSSNSTISTTTVALTNNATGARVIAGSGVAPAGAVAVIPRLRWFGFGAGATTVNVNMDAFQLSLGASPSYIDGDSAGLIWASAVDASGSGEGRIDSDLFTDGPLSTLGSSGIAGFKMPMFLTSFVPWSISPLVPDRQIAALALPDAVNVFDLTGLDKSLTTPATCGWHGERFAEERGALAIVNSAGPLADWVGERVRIENAHRSTYAYVYDARDIIEDISLTRRGFIALGEPSLDELDVTVTPTGAST